MAIGSLEAVRHLGKDQPIVVITDDTVPATNASSTTAASSTWTHLTPATDWLIPARAFHAMVYDSADGKVILFGGQADAGDLNDTWAYDPVANTWTELHPAGDLPSARDRHAMAYDSADRQGDPLWRGLTADDSTLNDTWAYDPAANTWTELHPAGGLPPARMGHAMVYDSGQQAR